MTDQKTEGLTVLELQASNVKRLKAITIRPDGSVVTVSGPNAAGKTSTLDAIMWGLGGKRMQPGRPVRDGEKEAVIEIDLGEFQVKRTIREGKADRLEVLSADGAAFPSPQTLLERMLGDLTFDALAFSRLPPAEQLNILRKLAGINTTEIDERIGRLIVDRAAANRVAKATRGSLESLPAIADAPDKEVDMADLRGLYQIAVSRDGEVNNWKRALASAKDNVERDERDARELVESIARLRERLEAEDVRLKQMLEAAKSNCDAVGVADQNLRAAVTVRDESLTPDDINRSMAEADAANKRFQYAAQRQKVADGVKAAKRDAEAAQDAVDAARDERTAMIEGGTMPLENLAIGDGVVLVNGLPLDQASSAEQLRVAAAIGMSLNPKIRVLLIRDGSLLDNAGLEALTELAKEREFQIWIERVAEPGEGVGIVIEDGEVVSAPAASKS